eukprot:3415827-Heterocapsa_arctica.AAC.1
MSANVRRRQSSLTDHLTQSETVTIQDGESGPQMNVASTKRSAKRGKPEFRQSRGQSISCGVGKGRGRNQRHHRHPVCQRHCPIHCDRR